MTDSQTLLSLYARTASESAFRELVRLRQEGAELKRLQGQDRRESALRIEGRSLAGSPGQRPPSRVRISRMACTSSLSFSRHESCFRSMRSAGER